MLQKLTALQTRRSNRIIESGRTLNYTDTGFADDTVYKYNPEFAFGKWWWSDSIGRATSNVELRIMSSTTGDLWTTHSTLFSHAFLSGQTGVILPRQFTFSDGYCLTIGHYGRYIGGSSLGDIRGYVGITNNGVDWNVYSNLSNLIPVNGLFLFSFGNGILLYYQDGAWLQHATISNEFATPQSVPYSITGNTQPHFRGHFLNGSFYLFSNNSSNQQLYATADFVTSSVVGTFPNFAGRTFLKYTFSKIKVNGLEMLWIISEEGTPKTFYFWKSFDGVYWEGSSLPASFYQNQAQPNWTASFGGLSNTSLAGGGGYVAINYTISFSVGFGSVTINGTLASSNFLYFGDFANASNIICPSTQCGPSFIRGLNDEYLISP